MAYSMIPSSSSHTFYGSVVEPPAQDAGAVPSGSCLDFPEPGDGGLASVPIAAIHEVVQRVIGTGLRACDDSARRFWHRTYTTLRSDMRQNQDQNQNQNQNRDRTGVATWGGICLEDLRWRYLQLSRSGDPSWRPLCGKIGEYFELRDQLQQALDAYRSPDVTAEGKVDTREFYENVAEAMRSALGDLRAERLHLTGAWPAPSAEGPPVRGRQSGIGLQQRRPLEASAPPCSLDFPSRLTPTAPPMSESWFDVNRIAYPPMLTRHSMAHQGTGGVDVSGLARLSWTATVSRP
ncbi:hypothetical protein [Roseateles sp. L2-2]|uniref:hypothetical protein n=1 Tax=Roseateles sp. L2-2 TaxID=3422597 RepID=UPI003D3672E7